MTNCTRTDLYHPPFVIICHFSLVICDDSLRKFVQFVKSVASLSDVSSFQETLPRLTVYAMRVQLEEVRLSFCHGMRAKDGQMTSAIWSAATCRGFPADARAIAPTSRRTPKEL